MILNETQEIKKVLQLIEIFLYFVINFFMSMRNIMKKIQSFKLFAYSNILFPNLLFFIENNCLKLFIYNNIQKIVLS